MTSTLNIAGRTFPLVGLVCPPHDVDPFGDWDGAEDSDWDRSLGVTSTDPACYIPAENGVLFEVEPMGLDRALLSLRMQCLACARQTYPDELWLPIAVGLDDGALVPTVSRQPGHTALIGWAGCEPEWVVETIDRLGHKPFTIPVGPRARMVPRGAVLEGAPT